MTEILKAKTSSVLSLLNNCITNMGKRRFAYNLTNPTDNICVRERIQYDRIHC